MKNWWKEAVVYQIYPRSFKDSNGDGMGDLLGIVEKLDYLKELGVDVIWLSPCYTSPNYDNGYDISDYRGIMTEFGTMAHWDTMIQEIHKRGMKLVMDLVVNHSSHEHPWFQAALRGEQPYKDYYIWREGVEGELPNNWRSYFSGPTWTYVKELKSYYLHLFTPQQPDLNWENPELRQEVYGMMTWWLDKGVDGFRMDTINMISKVPGLPNAEPINEPCVFGGEHFLNGPKVHQYIQEMNTEVLSKYDIMTVGETPGVSPVDAIAYSAHENNEINMVFQFELMGIDREKNDKWATKNWSLTTFKSIISKWQEGLQRRGWNSIYLNNHDQPRQVSRFGNDVEYRIESAKMLATMNMTLKGTPYIYQGEEIGMTNVKFDTIDFYQDVESLNMYKEGLASGKSPEDLLDAVHKQGRDNARTPMQWDATAHAGFTTGEPWLGVNPNYAEINADLAVKDENSIFHHYKKLLILRKENPVLVYGDYEEIFKEHQELFMYRRSNNQEEVLVILNFSGERVYTPLALGEYKLLMNNYPDFNQRKIEPYQALVLYKEKN